MQYFSSKGCENRHRGVELIDRTFNKWVSFETLLEEEEESFLFLKNCLFLVEIVDDNSSLYSTSASSVISQKSFRNFRVLEFLHFDKTTMAHFAIFGLSKIFS